MPRAYVAALLLLLMMAGCGQPPQAFAPDPSPATTATAAPPNVDLAALGTLRAGLVAALRAHVHGGDFDTAWGGGVAGAVAGPYLGAAPETDAAALQALRSAGPGDTASLAAGVTSAFRELDGARGGAYLLLADAAHPAAAHGPVPVDTPVSCPTPIGADARPECLRKQVSDGLLAAWYAPDTRMFFQVGQTSTVYRPIDAIAVGAALVVAGYSLHEDAKIDAGTQVLAKEMRGDVDEHYGLLYGLVTATAQGGRSVTDYNARLADSAGAAEAVMEAFDYSREAQQQAFAQRLLQPFLDQRLPARAAAGPYIAGLDLQTAGPGDGTPADVVATLLMLQAARHYDRDDGGHFSRLEEQAAAALLAGIAADRATGGDPATGLPSRLGSGQAQRSGLATALGATILTDVLRDLGTPPSAAGGAPVAAPSG